MSQATQPDQFLRQRKLEDGTPVARKELSGWVFGNIYLFVNSVFSRSVRSKLMWRDFKASPRGRRCERSGAARAYEVQPKAAKKACLGWRRWMDVASHLEEILFIVILVLFWMKSWEVLFSGKFSGSSSVRKELSIKKVHFLRPSQANFFFAFWGHFSNW